MHDKDEQARKHLRLGLISDTHGVLRAEALTALGGCDLIIHAGDVGDFQILERLRTVAPVVAIRGNIDKGVWASELPETAVVEAGGALIYAVHDVKQMDVDPAAAGFDIVISGHSHKPGQFERLGVLYVNPGSAGPRRFRLPVTIAHIDLSQRPWAVDFVDILAASADRPAAKS
jgi:putative phosphoesterase